MRNFNLLKTATIMLVLIFALTGVAYADNNTPKFTDIDGHWAKQHIINVYSKGLMGGSTETQFKPDEFIKNYDALVSISRMVSREKDINLEQLERKYQESVIVKYKVPEYAKEGILICLGKGIINEYDVSVFPTSQHQYATKNNISKYLGVALGVKIEENAPPVVLGFIDSLDVPTLYKPYVKFLMDKGIINKSKGANDKLNPTATLDRATFAKLLDMSNAVYEREKLGLSTEVIDSDTGTSDIPSGNNTIPQVIEEDETSTSTIGNNTSTSTVGNNTSTDIVENGANSADVTALVGEVRPEHGNIEVYIGAEKKIYMVADNAVCTIDDASSSYWKLKKNDKVRLYLSNGKIVKIIGESKVRKSIGKLVGVEAGDKTILTMQTSTGERKSYVITPVTVVIKDGKEAMWQELKSGNTLVVTTTYDNLVEINADGVKSTDKGVIESVVYSRMAPPKIVITALNGSQNEYYSNKSIEITGIGNDVYSLRPGMQVDVTLVDEEISKIAVINGNNSSQIDIRGMIKTINAESKLLVVEMMDINTNMNVDRKVFITNETKISDSLSNHLSIGSLKIDQVIIIFGTANTEGMTANTIMVLN